MADPIHKLAAQYFQLVELPNLALPPGSVLIQPDVQEALYERMFNENAVFPIPPDSYRSRVLKQILSRIEESITDPEEDVCPPSQFKSSFLAFLNLSSLPCVHSMYIRLPIPKQFLHPFLIVLV